MNILYWLYTLNGKEKSFIKEACDGDLVIEVPEHLESACDNSPILSNSPKIGKKEDLAKEYADNLMKTSRPYHVKKYGMEQAKNVADFDVYYVEQAYKKGWDACMKYLSELPWDEAMNEIVNNCKKKED